MPRLNDPDFWQPYLPQLRREFADLTMDILIAGGDAGAGAIRAGSVLIDWDTFNEDALVWLDMYLGTGIAPGMGEAAYAWAWSLNETTRLGVMREIDRWVRAGAPLPELERRLGTYFDKKRAARVAATEVTRIYASGNVMAWKASAVVSGKRWQTARDEMVCPVCGRLHNTFTELSGGWEFNAGALAADPALARALRAPLTVIVPPAHVNCILPGNKVVIPGRLSAAAQSLYRGKVIEIRTSLGRVLTVTQNHPILTPVGYVPAHLLREGSYVIGTRDANGIATAVNPDDDHVPTAIEEVFRAFKESPGVVATRVPVAAEDFHGDGRAINGYVDVVFINGLLQGDIKPAFGNPLGQTPFGGYGVALGLLAPPCPADEFVMRDNPAATGIMSRGDLSLPFVGRHERPFEQFGFGTAARLYSRPSQPSTNCPAVDTQTVSNGLFGFPGQIAGDNLGIIYLDPHAGPVFIDTGLAQDTSNDLERHAFLASQFESRFSGLIAPDEVIGIREYDFSGHVYDLQCDDYELYITEGVITSNCRCWLQPVVFEALSDDERAAGQFDPNRPPGAPNGR